MALLSDPKKKSALRPTKLKTEMVDASHVTVKDEPPEYCKTEPLVVKPEIDLSGPRKGAGFSELRLIRKDVIVGSKKALAFRAAASSDAAPEKKQVHQQMLSLKEKVSFIPSLAQQLHEVSSQKKVMPCPYCSYSSSSESNLKKHVATHKESNIELYSCLLCPFTTIYKYQLKTHTDRHSLEFGKHLCRFCNFSTSDSEDLEQHLRSHKTYEMLVCSYCGYKSSHRASFNKHIRKHGRPCPVCNYITFDKADMERHCESHLTVGAAPINEVKEENAAQDSSNIEFVCCGDDKDLKPSTDTECEQGTKQENAPRKAERNIADGTDRSKKWTMCKKLSGKNQYLCLLCNYSCQYKFSLRQHMVTHTGVGKLHCPYCKHESGNRSNLRKHVTAKHPGHSLLAASGRQ